MPFLLPNQQRQSTEGNNRDSESDLYIVNGMFIQFIQQCRLVVVYSVNCVTYPASVLN